MGRMTFDTRGSAAVRPSCTTSATLARTGVSRYAIDRTHDGHYSMAMKYNGVILKKFAVMDDEVARLRGFAKIHLDDLAAFRDEVAAA